MAVSITPNAIPAHELISTGQACFKMAVAPALKGLKNSF
jgi:hypothetical protein